MRKILFKAKRLDNGELVYGGSLITFLDNFSKSMYMPQFDEKCICEHDNLTDDILSFENCRFYKIDTNTLCQYTGLEDKNGKKIFEGDIVRCEYANCVKNIHIETVVFFDGCFMTVKDGLYAHICGKSKRFEHLDKSVYMISIEVIGNIHDKKEVID